VAAVVVIRDVDRLMLIDGYLRVEALRRLHPPDFAT
jgi:hypothetical protein